MLDGNDKQTFYSLMQLRDIVAKDSSPIILWVGAGASRWCNYPSWEELATQLHQSFSKYKPEYDKRIGSQLLGKSDFPAVFGLCRSIDTSTKTEHRREITFT